MGFREVLLLRSVLLLSGANLCAAAHNWLNFSTNETLNQIPQQEVTASLQLPRSLQITDHQSNRMEHSDPVSSPVSYRLKSYQLRNPAVHKQKPLQPPVEQMQTFQNPQRSDARELTSERLEPRETVQAPDLLNLQIQGPDLDPPVKQESKVLKKLFIFLTSMQSLWSSVPFKLSVIQFEWYCRCWCWCLSSGCQCQPTAWQCAVAKGRSP